jgi:hypothetical protein
VRVEVAHERRLVVQRRQVMGPAIAAAGGAAAQRVQAVRPGRPRDRAEPAITDGKLTGQMIVDRDVRAAVVTHDRRRVCVLGLEALQRRGVAGRKAIHVAAANLHVDCTGGVVGVLGNDRRAQMVDRIRAALMLVGQPFPQAIDVTTATLKRQIAEHVVEGAILHHQDDDVVDLLKVGPAGLLRHDTPPSVVLRYPTRGPRLEGAGPILGLAENSRRPDRSGEARTHPHALHNAPRRSYPLQIGASGIGATGWHTAGAIIIISKISAITPRTAGPREGGQSVSTAEAEAI